jgi:hypothetical protein
VVVHHQNANHRFTFHAVSLFSPAARLLL